MESRYSKILEKNQREIVLLKSFPCSYGKCSFCNYINDNSLNEDEMNTLNFDILSKVTGEFSSLEVINSGSVFELPAATLKQIVAIVKQKNIKIIYFEIYYGYHKRLIEIISLFPNTEVRFRTGIETFDNDFRKNFYNKNFSLDEATLLNLSQNIYSTCLLICVQGQTREMIEEDIRIGLKYFKSITINIFINNETKIKRDEELFNWFIKKYSHLKNHPKIELLIDNKDLGVFKQ